MRAEKEQFKPSLVKSARQKGGQDVPQGVNDRMRRKLRAGAEMEHRKKLGEGINGQPEPQHLFGAAQPGAQFVQLEVRKPEGAKEALVSRLSVRARARQPRGDGGLSIAENPRGRRWVQPTGSSRQHHGDLL
jgi:hypothetical protein